MNNGDDGCVRLSIEDEDGDNDCERLQIDDEGEGVDVLLNCHTRSHFKCPLCDKYCALKSEVLNHLAGKHKLNWVETCSVGRIMCLPSLLEEEKSFFSLWNNFMMTKGYDSGLGIVHMAEVVEQFIKEKGSLVIEAKLYTKFIRHLLNLNSDNLLSQGEMVRLQEKMIMLARGRQLDLH